MGRRGEVGRGGGVGTGGGVGKKGGGKGENGCWLIKVVFAS